MIYFDNASTNLMPECVKNNLMDNYNKFYANPSSKYENGLNAKNQIELCRNNILERIGLNNHGNIFFTSSASESNTWAIKGLLKYLKRKNKTHIISTKIEHKSILNVLKNIKNYGFTITLLDVDKNGLVSVDNLIDNITEETGLVSVMTVNNEIGSFQDIYNISKYCFDNGIIFHTDATQYIKHDKFNCYNSNNISLVSFSAHKFNGPVGIGGLYIRNDLINKIEPLVFGGQQEFGIRGGTESIPLISNMKYALCDYNGFNIDNYSDEFNIKNNYDYLISKLKKLHVKINGVQNEYGIISATLPKGCNAESALMYLENYEIYLSTGSACNSESKEKSHVLKAIGLSEHETSRTIRISLSKENNVKEVDFFINKLKEIIKILSK